MSTHSIERRVYYHDTDTGGVVYYANYLNYLEEGRVELFRSRGVDIGALQKQGIFFPVVRVDIEYKAPARYGDTIRIATVIEKIGCSSVHFIQEVYREAQLLARAKIIWVCVGSNFKSIPVAADTAAKLFPGG